MAGEPFAGEWQRLAHIAEQQKFGGWDAIRVGGEPPLTNIDLPIRKELAKMIVSSPVSEAELQHLTIEVPHQLRGQIEAGALGFQSPYETVEAAHR